MDYEQKYKETLERAKTLYENANGMILKKWVEQVFPELKELEDERIRKEIITYLKSDLSHKPYGDKFIESWITWLEKQGHQEEPQVYETEDGDIITYSKSEGYKVIDPKFEVGDWVVTDMNNIVQIKAVNNGYYTIDNGMDFNISYVDRCWHLWTIRDAKDGDVLADGDNNIGIFQECKDIYWDSYIYLGCDGELRGFGGIGGKHEQTNTHPATKEQRGILFKKMKENGCEWDAEKKELKKIIAQKPSVWSEKDDERIEQICDDLKCGLENFRLGKNVKGLHFEEIIKSNINWLKSLKERMKEK